MRPEWVKRWSENHRRARDEKRAGLWPPKTLLFREQERAPERAVPEEPKINPAVARLMASVERAKGPPDPCPSS